MPNFNEIREQLGGDNEPPFFVIHQGPLIVALCLREDFNPNINADSPEVWIGANVREWGDRLANDTGPVPLYVAPPAGGDYKLKGIYEVTQKQPTPDYFNVVMAQAPCGLSRIVYLMKNPIVNLVEKELIWFSEDRAGHPDMFPPQDNLYPIPFFGDIRRAEVLTLGLNPAWTEFRDERFWLPNTPAPAIAPTLASRLLHYFDLPVPEQHPWFDTCEKALLYIGCSYERNAAHIDVHPFPTNFVRDVRNLGDEAVDSVRALVQNRSASHLLEVLKLAERVKLVLVIDYAVPLLHGGNESIFDFLSNRVTVVANQIVQNGSTPPILRCPGHGGIADWVFVRRKALREYLRNAPPLDFHD